MLSPVLTLTIFQKQPGPKTFSAGEIIYEEGQPGNIMYGVLEGEVEVIVNHKVVETIPASEVFGAGVFVGVKNRTYTAVAKTDCKLAFIDEPAFLFAIQETPTFALKVMKSYSERLSRVEHLL